MKISVKNLGVLEHSEIDLSKKLNILCGTNNTGKTYMAYLVYGWNYLSNYSFNLFNRDLQVNYIASSNEFTINLLDSINFNKISGFLKTKLNEIFNQKGEIFHKTIIEIDNFQETLNNSKLLFDSIYFMGNSFSVFKVNDILYIKIPENLSIDNGVMQHLAIQSIVNILSDNPLIFPAERAAVNIFSKELSIKRNDLVDELLSVKNVKNRDKLLEERATRYPLPIRKSLEIAEDLARLSQKKSKYEYLAEEIEKKILKGKIKVNKYGEIQYSPSGTKNVNLPMHVSASMVKSLSSIVFYFRHLAQAGDLIIIDEPELNLHPDMQRAVARLLARFVNEGFKVLISTHSDYIIKELNLLIMLNNPDKPEAKELQKKYDYQDNELLKPEEIGVYLFKDRHSEVVPVSQEGFEIETIDKEINELNHAFKNIYFSLYD
ncbi:MAG: hypothetical protein EAZ08_01600 [Cytophagales bacterium]|nr:MAG: hypothetical protein EAZ08_01600 [Cytophagales bacterium]